MPFSSPQAHAPLRSQNGFALVLVLAVLILTTVLVLGFFLNIKTDFQSSKAYSDSNEVRMLEEIPVEVTMAQIRQATTENGTAWASQPGMIRTFDNSGNLAHAYKLYTSGTMIEAGVRNTDELTAMASWSTQPALFTDLNDPITAVTGGSTVSIYPVMPAPAAFASGTMEGYAVTSAPLATGSSANPVPMPALWLYVLQDGSLVAPVASGSSSVTVAAATGSNPIVGRIAFWTDDETCKLNVNTAGGDGIGTVTSGTTRSVADATFWDSPRFCAPDELDLASYQPAAGEFQRYPGHPATDALNDVLNALGWNLGSTDFYGLTPRYAYGGSKGGTVVVSSATSIPLATSRLYSSADEMLFSATSRTPSIINKTDAATQQRVAAAGAFLTACSRAPELNLFGQPRVSIWPVWDRAVSNPSISTTNARTAVDSLLAFCATSGTGTNACSYYFTRADNASSYTDVAIARNQQLLTYLDNLTSQAVPGYGGSFDTKYSQSVKRQILTEIFDYVRTVNEVDSSSTATVYAQQWNNQGGSTAPDLGFAQVAPSVVSSGNSGLSGGLQTWNTQGLGFFPRLTEVTLQFIALGRGALPGGASAIPLQANYNTTTSRFTAGDLGTDPVNSATTTNAITINSGTVFPPGNTASGSAPTMAVQALLLLNFVNPAETRLANPAVSGGANTVDPFIAVEVSGLDTLTLSGTNTPHSLAFPNDDSMILGLAGNNFSNVPFFSGVGIRYMMTQCYSTSSGRLLGTGYGKTTGSATTKFQNAFKDFPFYSKIIPISIPASGTGGTMTLNGGTITIKVYDGASHATGPTLGNVVQTYTINIPAGTFPVPVPDTTNTLGPPLVGLGGFSNPSDIWLPGSSDANQNGTGGGLLIRNGLGSNLKAPGANGQDTMASMVLSGSASWSDPRLLAVNVVPPAAFTTHSKWGQAMAHSLYYGAGTPFPGATATGVLAAGASYNVTPGVSTSTAPIVLASINGAVTKSGALGDWDNGLANDSDGPWINKADEGEVYTSAASLNLPYFAISGKTTVTGSAFFSPNREVPSPGMFGSLPTGIDPTGSNPKPWQTLLFRPGPPGHPGIATPPDHLFLDLFWMPIAEPYAISEPLSSAGKVNLNYQLMPYTYITRSTALRAVLGTEKVAAVDVSQSKTYKVTKYDTSLLSSGMSSKARLSLNLDATLAQFDDKFNGTNNSGENPGSSPDIFRSASQICDMYLVPGGYSSASLFASDWYGSKFALVGDNVRERPYTNIYGRITTKSNTYRVHYRVQSLRKRVSSDQTAWQETQDTITGEKRGSVLFERYIDPNAATTDFAASPNTANSLEASYKFRIISSTSVHP